MPHFDGGQSSRGSNLVNSEEYTQVTKTSSLLSWTMEGYFLRQVVWCRGEGGVCFVRSTKWRIKGEEAQPRLRKWAEWNANSVPSMIRYLSSLGIVWPGLSAWGAGTVIDLSAHVHFSAEEGAVVMVPGGLEMTIEQLSSTAVHNMAATILDGETLVDTVLLHRKHCIVVLAVSYDT